MYTSSPSVVSFWGLYLGSYKVIPKRNYVGVYVYWDLAREHQAEAVPSGTVPEPGAVAATTAAHLLGVVAFLEFVLPLCRAC